jgi:hypothetical protein
MEDDNLKDFFVRFFKDLNAKIRFFEVAIILVTFFCFLGIYFAHEANSTMDNLINRLEKLEQDTKVKALPSISIDSGKVYVSPNEIVVVKEDYLKEQITKEN